MTTSRQRLLLLLAAWGLAVATAGAFDVLTGLPTFVVPLLIVVPTAALLFGLRPGSWLADGAAAVSLRALVALHLGRFVGIYFLWLHGQGRLPADFAYRAGWGDIAAAAGAWLLLFVSDPVVFRRVLPWWNAFSLADLAVAVGTGGWLNVAQPGSMAEIVRFPAVLIPLFAVPLLAASHVIIHRRLRDLRAEVSDVTPAAANPLAPRSVS